MKHEADPSLGWRGCDTGQLRASFPERSEALLSEAATLAASAQHLDGRFLIQEYSAMSAGLKKADSCCFVTEDRRKEQGI